MTGSGESVLVNRKSARGMSRSESVAELFSELGSVTPPGAVTVAVLASVPVALEAIVPVTV